MTEIRLDTDHPDVRCHVRKDDAVSEEVPDPLVAERSWMPEGLVEVGVGPAKRMVKRSVVDRAKRLKDELEQIRPSMPHGL